MQLSLMGWRWLVLLLGLELATMLPPATASAQGIRAEVLSIGAGDAILVVQQGATTRSVRQGCIEAPEPAQNP